MSNFTIKVLNTEIELKSFPLKQAIKLQSSVELEDSLLAANITLIRDTQDFGLLNSSELYNYNIGYVKEKFSVIPIDIKTSKDGDTQIITCIPKDPLAASANYILFINKDISNEYINITKTVSKSNSALTLADSSNLTTDAAKNNVYKLKVISSPLITATNNIIKFQLYTNDIATKVFTIDAKSSNNTITFDGIKVLVKDTAYGLDEEFKINITATRASLPNNLVLKIHTASVDDIKPIENVNPSNAISNQDILDYYKTLEPVVDNIESERTIKDINFKDSNWMDGEFNIEYLGYDRFILNLKSLTANDLDLDNIKMTEFPAFNRYDLELVKLYDPKEEFTLTHEVLEDKSILFQLIKKV